MTRLIFVFTCVFACVSACVIGFALPVHAQGAPSPAAPTSLADVARRLDALAERVEAMTADAARAATLGQSVDDLAAELQALAQRLDVLAREQQSIPDARARIDELSAAVVRLRDDLGAVRERVADVERHGGGGAQAAPGTTGNPLGFRAASGRLAIEPMFLVQTRGQLDASGGFDDIEALEVRLPRVRVGFWGHVGHPDLSFHINLDPVGDQSLLDAFVQYRVRDELSIRVGQTRVPFGRGWLTEPFRFVFPERARATRDFRYDRDVQVTLLGALLDGRLAYRASVGNGAGFNQRNQNTELFVAGRVEAAVLGDRVEVMSEGDRENRTDPYLTVAVAANHNLVPLPALIGRTPVVNDVDGDGEIDNVRLVNVGADAQFKWRGLAIAGEWFLRSESYGTILEGNPSLRQALDRLDGDDATGLRTVNDDNTRLFQGFYVQGTYFVVPRTLALGSRLGRSRELLLPFAGRNNRDAPPTNYAVWEVDAIAQLYWDRAGGRFLGLQYSYANGAAEPGMDATNGHRVLIETQFQF